MNSPLKTTSPLLGSSTLYSWAMEAATSARASQATRTKEQLHMAYWSLHTTIRKTQLKLRFEPHCTIPSTLRAPQLTICDLLVNGIHYITASQPLSLSQPVGAGSAQPLLVNAAGRLSTTAAGQVRQRRPPSTLPSNHLNHSRFPLIWWWFYTN